MIRIEFTGQAQDVLAEMRLLLGTVPVPAAERWDSWAHEAKDEAPAAEPEEAEEEERVDGRIGSGSARRYGQPSAGKARRTKAEMAEDTEIDELAAALDIDVPNDNVPVAKILLDLRGRSAAAQEDFKPSTPQRAITATPESRVGPQDEPEKVEEKPASKTTREDLKAAMAKYVEAVGMADAMERFPSVSGYAKQSEIPDDAAVFDEIIAKLEKDAANG